MTSDPQRAHLIIAFREWWVRVGGTQALSSYLSSNVLLDCWSGKDRYYHTRFHLMACLNEFRPVRMLAQDPDAVELALWCHDAIYHSRDTDNEEKSAEVARRIAFEVDWNLKRGEMAADMVLATKHGGLPPADSDTALLLDIDLTILGADLNSLLRHPEWGMEPLHVAGVPAPSAPCQPTPALTT